ncbi:MAG: glycosyltransferase family 2 protein [Lachnospiraceae bacterium]|nr:glycosyltransferase family 2 protein [Candidatus Equihabitans merdae]
MSDKTSYEERYEQLKKDYAELYDKFIEVRETAIARGEAAARLGGESAVRLYRKMQVKSGHADPLQALRPLLNEAQSGIRMHIDNKNYRKGDLTIRGWCWDLKGAKPGILIRDRSKVLEFVEHRYPRKDVNEMLGLADDVCTGFTVRVALKDIAHSPILVEFENELGYVPVEVEVLLSEKERQAYLDGNAHPVYAYDSAGYDDWIRDRLVTEEELAAQRAEVFPYSPKISICIPLYNTKPQFLKELMDGLLGQSYSNIEICLADGSPEDDVEREVREKYLQDPRVVYKRLEKNEGISGNTNASFEMASGDFIMLSDHDDVVEKDACYEIVKMLNSDENMDVVYTDEDKIMLTEGVYYSPNFKPDFDIDLLRSNNYITHIFVVRKSIVDEVGGEDSSYDGAQDYDFILRCCEKARSIGHVPKFLYHWRAHESSTAGNPESKMYAYENGRRAIESHYKRCGIDAEVELAEDIGSYRTTYRIQGNPLVSIIIPNKDLKDTLKRAVDSILEKSTYTNYEIVIAENNSTEQETFDYYKEVQAAHENVRVVTWQDAFNYSAINNFAAREAKGDYYIFLNNDTEVITDRWIEEMLGYCQREDVGICGARLYYPDDRLQHCGIVVGIGGIAGHICHLEKRGNGGYFGRVVKTQDISAVTAACLMISKKVFDEVNGFDEELAVAYNDVDLCLKVREKGYLVVYNAWCLLYHYESLSRGSDDAAIDEKKHARQMAEAAILKSHFPEIFEKGDPYFNPNLDYDAADYVLKGTIPPNYSTLEKKREEKA